MLEKGVDCTTIMPMQCCSYNRVDSLLPPRAQSGSREEFFIKIENIDKYKACLRLKLTWSQVHLPNTSSQDEQYKWTNVHLAND